MTGVQTCALPIWTSLGVAFQNLWPAIRYVLEHGDVSAVKSIEDTFLLHLSKRAEAMSKDDKSNDEFIYETTSVLRTMLTPADGGHCNPKVSFKIVSELCKTVNLEMFFSKDKDPLLLVVRAFIGSYDPVAGTVGSGARDAVEILLKRGADPNRIYNDRTTFSSRTLLQDIFVQFADTVGAILKQHDTRIIAEDKPYIAYRGLREPSIQRTENLFAPLRESMKSLIGLLIEYGMNVSLKNAQGYVSQWNNIHQIAWDLKSMISKDILYRDSLKEIAKLFVSCIPALHVQNWDSTDRQRQVRDIVSHVFWKRQHVPNTCNTEYERTRYHEKEADNLRKSLKYH